LYGCKTWSFTLREERRWRVFENRVLKRIFGPNREKVAGGWRGLHKKQLHSLFAITNIIKVTMSKWIKWAEHVARMGEMRNEYNILIGKPEG